MRCAQVKRDHKFNWKAKRQITRVSLTNFIQLQTPHKGQPVGLPTRLSFPLQLEKCKQ